MQSQSVYDLLCFPAVVQISEPEKDVTQEQELENKAVCYCLYVALVFLIHVIVLVEGEGTKK